MASPLVKMCKDLSKIFNQRVKEDRFNRTGKSVIDVPFAPSLGETHRNPVGRLITGPLESFAIHKGLQKDDRMVVNFLPVLREDSDHSPQEVRCQMGNLDPGKNEEAGILGNEMDVSISVIGLPSDEVIPRGHLPGCSSPAEASQRPPLMEGHILEMFSHGLTVTQVMVGLDEALVERFPMRAAYHLEIDGPQLLHSSLDGFPGVKWNLYRPPSAGSPSMLYRRECHQPRLLETQEEFAARHGLKHAVPLSPIPEAAEFFGDESPASTLMLFNNRSNKGNIIASYLSAPDDKRYLHGL
jgi:hypothetical protein